MRRIVLIFARDPRDERWAKPLRVARDLRRAVEAFHRAALDCTIDAAVESEAAVRLCTTREPERPLDAAVEISRQRSGSMGERLAYAFAEAFRDGYRQVVVIGGDTPELSARHLRTAFARLDGEQPTAALGPSPDGGYWLLGLNGFTSAAFSELPWKTPRLCFETRRALERAHFAVEELEELADVDGFRDLERLAARLRGRDDALELRAAALAVIADAARDAGDPPARSGLARLVLSALRSKGPLPV